MMMPMLPNSSPVPWPTTLALSRAVALLVRYFSVDETLAQQEILALAEQYPLDWIGMAVLEALYQGRYKVVSVGQILAIWQRRGKVLCHFNWEFESMMMGPLKANPPRLLRVPHLVPGSPLSAKLKALWGLESAADEMEGQPVPFWSDPDRDQNPDQNLEQNLEQGEFVDRPSDFQPVQDSHQQSPLDSGPDSGPVSFQGSGSDFSPDPSQNLDQSQNLDPDRGVNHHGVNHHGVNQNGTNHHGANQNGVNQNGTNHHEVNQNGVNHHGVNQNGVNHTTTPDAAQDYTHSPQGQSLALDLTLDLDQDQGDDRDPNPDDRPSQNPNPVPAAPPPLSLVPSQPLNPKQEPEPQTTPPQTIPWYRRQRQILKFRPLVKANALDPKLQSVAQSTDQPVDQPVDQSID